VLLVPAFAQLFEAGIAVGTGFHVGLEAAAVHPRPGAVDTGLERDDAAGSVVQELAVVADEEHGLL
jgi:hypothetical protein